MIKLILFCQTIICSLQCHTYLAILESFGDIFRDGGTGEAAVLPNFRGLLKGNFNDFGKKKGKKF